MPSRERDSNTAFSRKRSNPDGNSCGVPRRGRTIRRVDLGERLDLARVQRPFDVVGIAHGGRRRLTSRSLSTGTAARVLGDDRARVYPRPDGNGGREPGGGRS